MRSALALTTFVLLVAGAASFGARFTPGAWYASLTRPPLTPPSWVFGPVWSLLYLGIAVAAFLVWRSGSDDAEAVTRASDESAGPRSAVTAALILWTAQLALNALWSYLFFGLERPAAALINIVALVVLVIATGVAFHGIHRVAGLLFVPYALWVSFATYLNAGFWWLNRGG